MLPVEVVSWPATVVVSPKPGTRKSQGFKFLSVILASWLSGSIDDVLGDLLGDDSKCRLTRVGGVSLTT